MYLSGSTTEFFKSPDVYGVMFNTSFGTGRNEEALKTGCKFDVDNGIYGGKWTEASWLLGLWQFWPYRSNCLVCPLPDWLDKLPDGSVRGDWQKTLDRFYQYHNVTRRMGFPVTLVTQDGLKPSAVPWHLIDAIFVGGSNYHKRGIEAELLAIEAKRRGKYVHVGRVSAVSTAAKFWPWADSYDGTTFTFEPDAKHEKLTPQWRQFFNENSRPHQLKLF